MNVLLLIVFYIFISFVITGFVFVIRVRTMKIYTGNTMEPYDVKSVLGLDVNIFDVMSEKFYRNGFELVGEFKITDINTKKRYYSREFVHKNLATLAGITYFPNGLVGAKIQNRNDTIFKNYRFSISTRFTDETGFLSTSIDRPKVFKYDRIEMIANQDMKDLDSIIYNHVLKVKELMNSKSLDYSLITTERQQLMDESFVKRMDNQVKHGILVYDSINDCYRYTWNAAIKGFFKEMALKFFKKREVKSRSTLNK